ncbi:MAG: aldose 1-epimerase family protein, partial [Bdellovibrio sp.]
MTLQNQHSISSTNYKLIINSHGAELAGLYWKDLDHNWIWSGDSWKRHAPILFPIVGRLKNDRYTVNGSSYELSQHGFARDMEFSVTEASANAITFKLTSSTKTFEKYPFHFDLFVRYEVSNDDMAVTFKVHSKEEIYFSIGWHPAFVFPDQKSLMEDLRVAWEKPQTSYHLLSKEGLIAPEALMMPSPLNIEPSTFQKDALIFKE